MFQTKVVEEIKKHILRSITTPPPPQKVVLFVYKCGTAGQATDDDVRCTRIARWIPKATNTLSEYAILTAYPQQKWLLERASMLVIRTWPILFLWRNPTHENVYRPES